MQEAVSDWGKYFSHPGDRTNVAGSDLSEFIPEEIEAEVKLAAEISMGTEVSEEDIGNIRHLCDQVCFISSMSRRENDFGCLPSTVRECVSHCLI